MLDICQCLHRNLELGHSNSNPTLDLLHMISFQLHRLHIQGQDKHTLGSHHQVYAILMVQLAITFGFVALFIYEPHVKLFVQQNFGAYIAAYVSFIVIYIALVCCESLRRTYPTNMILLFVFFDFTSCAGFLFIAVWALFLFGILTIFTYNRFLAFDTQMLMGGRKLELSPEEHIFAALQLYMDIVQIFLFLLRILGRR
ncbi:hypothetical protein HPB49_025677 [Dermacentor silvarum]|nr:hypothetical protein HPB49_025677 [Dermacentor silvarum]